MTHDNPNLTAYVLDELDAREREQIADLLNSDSAAARIVDETELIARILSSNFAHSRRRLPLVPMALAASILIVGMTISLLCRSTEQPRAAIAGKVQFVASTSIPAQPARSILPENMPAIEVEQFVAGVLADASRVGTFSPLRLTSDSPASDLPILFQ